MSWVYGCCAPHPPEYHREAAGQALTGLAIATAEHQYRQAVWKLRSLMVAKQRLVSKSREAAEKARRLEALQASS